MYYERLLIVLPLLYVSRAEIIMRFFYNVLIIIIIIVYLLLLYCGSDFDVSYINKLYYIIIIILFISVTHVTWYTVTAGSQPVVSYRPLAVCCCLPHYQSFYRYLLHRCRVTLVSAAVSRQGRPAVLVRIVPSRNAIASGF